jgi:hypothetical protein
LKKQFHILFLSCFLLTIAGMGQNDTLQRSPANIVGLKMSFITKQLALTNDEAQKFWPVYYSYAAELRRARLARKEDVLGQEEEILNVRKKYRAEFKKILNSDERVNKTLTIDRDFNNVIKQELQDRARARGGKQ